MTRSFKKDIFITGFALFAMFFGAGNLIFPPFLGWSSGRNWLAGILCFILVDVGLSLLVLFVLALRGLGEADLAFEAGGGAQTWREVPVLSVAVVMVWPAGQLVAGGAPFAIGLPSRQWGGRYSAASAWLAPA